MVSYLGLYIKMKFLPSVPLPLSLPVLLNVFGVICSVLLQVVWMLIEPLFDPRVVVVPTVGILPPPSRIVFCFEGFFTRRFSTDLLSLTPSPWGWNKKSVAIGTLPCRHLRFLWGCHKRIIQTKGSKRPTGMRRKNLFLSLSRNKRNYKVGIYDGSSIVIFGTVFIVAHSPDCLSWTILTEMTLPAWEKRVLISASVAWKGRLATYTFLFIFPPRIFRFCWSNPYRIVLFHLVGRACKTTSFCKNGINNDSWSHYNPIALPVLQISPGRCEDVPHLRLSACP